MAEFVYRAVDSAGRSQQGEIEARSRSEAFALLSARRLQPLTIQVKGEAGSAASPASAPISKPPSGAAKLTPAQQLLFTKELVELLEAGLQLEQALGVMETREERSALKVVAGVVRARVREGSSFSKALRDVGAGFPSLYISMVAAGEVSGALGKILQSQAEFMAFVQDLQKRLVSAMVYPCVVLTAGVALLIVFMTFLLPQLTVLLGKTGQQLPLVTRMLVGSSDWFGQWWWAVVLGIIALVAGQRMWVATAEGRKAWDRIILRVPLFGELLQKRFLTQFLQTLATLVSNGVVLLQGLNLVRGTFGNTQIDAAIERVAADVSEGIPLSRSMKKQPIFPPALIDIMRIGEQTGDISTALRRGAQKYDREFTVVMERFSTLIQPLSILIVALFVGLVAYAMITGILTTVSGLRMR
jgi:type II secretory pathway component PulF